MSLSESFAPISLLIPMLTTATKPPQQTESELLAIAYFNRKPDSTGNKLSNMDASRRRMLCDQLKKEQKKRMNM